MQAFKLIAQAIRFLFRDIWATIRLTVLPVLIGYGLAILAVYLFSGDGLYATLTGVEKAVAVQDAGFHLGRMSAAFIVFTTYCWAAIGWHRFVLLDEQPGVLLPKFNWAFAKPYIWAVLRLGLVTMGMLVLSLMIMTVGGRIGVGTMLFWGVCLTVIGLRLSLVLPAAAIGKPISMGKSWELSYDKFVTWLLVASALVGVNVLGQMYLAPGYLGWAISFFLSWFSFAIGISILTTIYGVYAEKRPL